MCVIVVAVEQIAVYLINFVSSIRFFFFGFKNYKKIYFGRQIPD